MTSYNFKPREIKSALKKKGFQETNSHHKQLVLVVDGKITRVHTYVSHGFKEYSGKLLASVREQLGGLTNDEFRDLVKCPMDGPTYVKLLRERRYVLD